MLMLRMLRLGVRVLLGLVVLVVLYFGVTLVQVYLTGRHYEPHHADAIVVMGAAQYNGVPSPDLRARLNEALGLYHGRFAPVIVVTGSKEQGDAYTEAEAGARYLEGAGVPSSAILEAGGNDSWQNLSDAASALKSRRGSGDATVLVTTDPFHEDRSMAIASDVGLMPYPTPTRTSPITGWASAPYYLKEMLGVGFGRVIGYQNLHAFG
jgi:uncharacterized SAM-binding protein YcdF (DUF218 family)